MKKLEAGNFVEWLLMFVAISIVIFFFVVVLFSRSGLSGFNAATTGTTTGSITQGTTVKSGARPAPARSYISTSSTVSASTLSLGLGNASGAYQPADEYITLTNNGDSPVDITGYRLENGKSSRSYAVGSTEVHYASDTATIPRGAKVIPASGSYQTSDMVLSPGERAVVTTGSPGNLTPFQLVSFKENKCTGYLYETYRFSSGNSGQCVAPSNEAGVQSLDISCQDYISTIRSCHTPKFRDDPTMGPLVDEQNGLSGACMAYIKANYSYAGCLANHINDPKFEGRTWHVYLYKPWEMWASSHETVSLYDTAGRLVDRISY